MAQGAGQLEWLSDDQDPETRFASVGQKVDHITRTASESAQLPVHHGRELAVEDVCADPQLRVAAMPKRYVPFCAHT